MVGHELATPELASQGVQVVGVHVGSVDEVLADEASVQLKAALSAPIEVMYPDLKTANA